MEYSECFSTGALRVKFTSVDVLTLCFSEKLPAAGNLTFIFRGQWPHMKWARFSPTDSEGRSNNSVGLEVNFLDWNLKGVDEIPQSEPHNLRAPSGIPKLDFLWFICTIVLSRSEDEKFPSEVLYLLVFPDASFYIAFCTIIDRKQAQSWS